MSARKMYKWEVEEVLGKYGLSTYRTLDAVYWACDEAYLDYVLSVSPPPREYWADFDDCDDRAERFKVFVHEAFALSAGIVVNDVHAFNVFVMADGTCRFVDAGWSDGPVYVTPGAHGHFYDVRDHKVWL